ncbi:hypothetical protein [Thioclava sp. GXIMD2076]|uniref:Transferrin-binding protein B C-lobe/N-lobe beta barrel domain-containing protein n=1 Tax=Thioclava kandeliae TaxID=3070818 RepID=A0ABV1SCG3_9RHOB
MRIQLTGIALLACTTLAACGSSGSSGGGSGSLSLAEANNIVSQYNAIEDALESGDATLATDATGEVSMSGYMGFGVDETEDSYTEALGELSMDVDFDNGTVSGTAQNFALYEANDDDGYSSKDSDLDGMLAVDGTISSAVIDASVTGTLSDGEGSGTVDFVMEGGVFEQDDELMAIGDVDGLITFDDESTFESSGGFYARED